jgi:hypothetical protein
LVVYSDHGTCAFLLLVIRNKIKGATMTTNLHDKMLAAIDALFSASDAVEEEVAENLLLDVRDEIRKQPAQQEPVRLQCTTCGTVYADGVPPQVAQQEPVAIVTSESGNPDVVMSWWHEPPLPVGTPLYTSQPAQRTWVGLTDGELDDLHRALKIRLMGTFDTKDIYRAIEAKLKDKNT